MGELNGRELPEFNWVNRMLGNRKATLARAFHAFKYHHNARVYLGAFAYRFNRRVDLRELVVRLMADVAG